MYVDCSTLLPPVPDLPPDAKIHYRRGCALIGIKDFSEAVEAFNRALQIEPSNPTISKKLNEANRYLTIYFSY